MNSAEFPQKCRFMFLGKNIEKASESIEKSTSESPPCSGPGTGPNKEEGRGAQG